MKPDDPVCDGLNLAYGGDAYDDPDGELIQIGHDGRAAFQRRAALFLGVDFGEVSALRRYARVFTRQEAWDAYGRDDFEDCCPEDAPETVPDAWQPNPDAPAWEFADRFDEHGFPVLIAEEC